MDEVEKRVATKFTIDDSSLSKLGALSTAFSGLGGLISRATSMINPLNVAIGAMGGALSGHAIMKAGSEFEDLQIGLAQTLRFMGVGGATFADAMHNSSVAMRQIIADAGPLPGNALDYANAMQVAGAVVQRATGDYQKSYDLIKSTTAVAISIGGSAQLAAVELNRMLDAQKGMLHQYGDFNNKLLNAMRQLPGYAGITVHEFNKFDLHKRLEIVTKAMGQFDDMVKASSSTWTAVKGAIEASSTLLVKSATAPLFEAAKGTLSAINSAILQADGNFTKLGQTIVNVGVILSESIVSGLHKVVELAGKAGGVLSGGGGMAAAHGAATGNAGAIFSMANPALAGFVDYLTRAGNAMALFDSLSGVVGTLLSVLGPFADVAQQVTSLLGDAFEGTLTSVIGMFNDILGPLVTYWSVLSATASVVMDTLHPAFVILFSAVGDLATGIGQFLGPVLLLLGGAATSVIGVLADVLTPVLRVAAGAVSSLVSAIGQFLGWLGKLIGGAASALGLGLTQRAPASLQTNALSEFITKFRERFKDLGKAGGAGAMAGGGAAIPKADTPMHRGGGGRAVQDFRYSRFEITQKFAEGFDPDRIAVAFAQDIGRIGEQRMQSGFEPQYAVR